MEHDVIILYLIAGVSFTFALFNCILFTSLDKGTQPFVVCDG